MTIPFQLKYMITVAVGLFGTMAFLIWYLSMKGIITLGVHSQANDAFFLSFVFNFLAGMMSMVLLEVWERKSA